MSKQFIAGDTVYADFSKYGRISVREGEVINVSPTGVVKVRFTSGTTTSFMPNGRERGANWDGSMLITKQVYQRLAEKENKQNLANEINRDMRRISDFGIKPDGSNKADIIRMLELVIAKANSL